MQNVQSGGTEVAIRPLLTVVICEIESMPKAKSTWLSLALLQWKPKARVIQLKVARETQVLGKLRRDILPRIEGPVVVFNANTTSILDLDLDVWIGRWISSDRLVWVTATDDLTGPAWSFHVNINLKGIYGRGVQSLPIWGAFSGVADALRALIHKDTETTVEEAMAQWCAKGQAYCDVTPLVSVGYSKPRRPKHASAKVMRLLKDAHSTPSKMDIFFVNLKKFVQAPSGKGITAAACIILVLFVIVVILAVVFANAKKRLKLKNASSSHLEPPFPPYQHTRQLAYAPPSTTSIGLEGPWRVPREYL